MLFNRVVFLASICSLSLFACSGSKSDSQKESKTQEINSAEPSSVKENKATGLRKRFSAPIVYLDGEAVAVLRFGELPPHLKSHWKDLGNNIKARQFRWAEYIEELGVPLSSLKALTLHGGRGRVAVLSANEVRRFRESLKFSFNRSNSGKARMEWQPPSRSNDHIDMVHAVALYVKKKAPRLNKKTSLVELNGEIVADVPYVTQEMRNGVRVYKDGRIVTIIKRNLLTASEGKSSWKLKPFLEKADVKLDDVMQVDLVYQDRIENRVTIDALASMSFRFEEDTGGHLLIQPRDLEISALILHSKEALPIGSR